MYDIATVYIGNQYDTVNTPIHLDFRIAEIQQVTMSSGEISHIFKCELALVNQYANMHVSIKNSSIEVLKMLCTEMQIGLVTNITKTDDTDFYNQYALTNIDYIKHITSKLFVSDDSAIHAFIDQYCRLNVIDVANVLSNTAKEISVLQDIVFFKDLDKPEQLIINNAKFDTTKIQYKLSSYKSINKQISSVTTDKPIVSTIIKKDYSAGTITSTVKNTNYKNNAAQKSSDIANNDVSNATPVQTVYSDGMHNANMKQFSDIANNTKLKYFINNVYLSVDLVNHSNTLNLYQIVPVEIYNEPVYIEIPFASKDKNLQTSNEALSADGSESINTTLSADYAIAGMTFKYSLQLDKIVQELKFIKRIWNTQKYESDEIDMSDASVGPPSAYTIPEAPPPPPIDNTNQSYGYSSGSFGNWMSIAKGELGTSEIPGAGSNPKITEYHKVGGALGNTTPDGTPWCASFVGWCMVKAGFPHATAAAISYASYGVPCPPGTVGAIIVMKMKPGNTTSSGNHVAFCRGIQGERVLTLGGNQSDAVTESSISLGKVISWRLPPGAPSQNVANAGNSAASTGPYRISQNGVNFLKNREGCKLQAYQDTGGVWTIGYGHTKTARAGMSITYQQAEYLLRQDLAFFENGVNANINVKMTQSMYDALVSFAYNLGMGRANKSSKIGQLMNARQYAAASDVFPQYVNVKGKRSAGLVTRRNMERGLFLSQGSNPV
jgi:lysozyme